MPSVYSLFDLGRGALAAHRAAADLRGRNLSGLAVPGYARRAPTFGGLPGAGARLLGERAQRLSFLDARFAEEKGLASHAEARALALDAVDTGFAAGEGSAAAAVDRLFRGLRALTADPAGGGARAEVVAAAQETARAFRSQAAVLDASRRALDAEVQDAAARATEIAGKVAALNRRIIAAEGGGGRAEDLRGERALLVEEAAALLGARAVEGKDGVSLFLPGGAALVSGPIASRVAVSRDAANAGLLAVTLEGPNGSAAVAWGGRLGGVLRARDTDLPALQARLDEAAFALANALNAVHRAGFGLDGQSGRDLFAPPAAQGGAAAALAVAAEVAADPDALATAQAAGLPGDNRVALQLVAVGAQAVSSGRTAGELLAALAGEGGRLQRAADDELAGRAAALGEVERLREQVMGVSADEEMVELMKAQRGFEAAARLVEAADEMLQTVLRLR